MSVLTFVFRVDTVAVGFNVGTKMKQPRTEREGMLNHLMAYPLSAYISC